MITKSRRSGRALTSCLRCALAEGSTRGASLSRAFLRDLKHLDPGLELHFIPGFNRWVLYRLARRGIIPSEDRMVKELEVKGPNGEFREPGQWLLDWLRRHDKTRNGSVCPEYANRQVLRSIDLEPKEEEERLKATSQAMGERLGLDLEKYVLRGKKSQDLPKGTSEILKRKRNK